MRRAKHKTEYGDFQTPLNLARDVCTLMAARGVRPRGIVEPTCGIGNFLVAALDQFPAVERAIGLDINANYLAIAKSTLKLAGHSKKVELAEANLLEPTWSHYFDSPPEPVLVIGNPPWVTSAQLGTLGSRNLPKKGNYDGLSGVHALTGKSNFDISEWMLLRIAEQLDEKNAVLAMLCKTSVARKVLRYVWRKSLNIRRAEIFGIDAPTHFAVSVDACLLICEFSCPSGERNAAVYRGLTDETASSVIAYRNGELVADVRAYERLRHLQGSSAYQWRSGIKHDCRRVMQFSRVNGHFRNAAGEVVELEDDYLYPMLKGSEVANGKSIAPTNWMLVPQERIGAETEAIRRNAPKTWDYLERNARYLDRRRSSIYRNRPRFSVFGVGEYSFSPWKVAICGFYKKLQFCVVGTFERKPIVLDDTTYFISCQSEREAKYIASILNSQIAREFFSAFVFWDMKRPITIDVLRRLDLFALAGEMGVESTLRKLAARRTSNPGQKRQGTLFP